MLYWLGHGDGKAKLPGTRAEIEALLDARADAPMAGRSREEIIARAMDRAAEAAALHLDPAVADAIAKLLDISGPADDLLARIRELLKTAGINLDPQLAAMDARLATLKTLGVDPARVQFTAHFGRNMEYYTGFVFELVGAGQGRPRPDRGRRPLRLDDGNAGRQKDRQRHRRGFAHRAGAGGQDFRGRGVMLTLQSRPRAG